MTENPLMTAEDISVEIFNSKRSARQISERDSKLRDYPKTVNDTGKKFWRRHEIYTHYRLIVLKNAA